ncbi:MAG: hypothetical protein HKP20_05390 [Akkermansiaceae bacterium]|nr:hypothetical protein [Akkermansiaceae bacterium]
MTINPSTGAAEKAAVLLTAEDKARAREVEAVEAVRLPVLRKSGAVELLPPGYDEESKIFSLAGAVIDDDMDGKAGADFLLGLFAGFPFAVEGAAGDSRSRGNALAVQLGVFCRRILPKQRQSFVYNTHRRRKDSEPSGAADILMHMALAPTCGKLIIEELAGNQFAGASGLSMVSNEHYSLTSGEGLKLEADPYGSHVVIDIFEGWRGAAPVEDVEVTLAWLATDDGKGQLLSAMWAVVKTWMEAGQPRPSYDVTSTAPTTAAAVGGMVEMVLPEARPFTARTYDTGVYDMEKGLRLALAGVAPESGGDLTFRENELSALLRSAGCLGFISGACCDLPTGLRHARPVEVRVGGRLFEFAHDTRKNYTLKEVLSVGAGLE